MTSLKTSIKTITYLSDIGCLEIQGASLNDKILSYTESMAGKREMVIITFKSGETFQVEVPGSQHIDSQKKAIERMKDTLRITYLTETKIDKLCVWNNKTPNSIAAISMKN